MSFIKKVYNAIRPKPQRELEDEWLSQSGTLEELERRMKMLENKNLKGWV